MGVNHLSMAVSGYMIAFTDITPEGVKANLFKNKKESTKKIRGVHMETLLKDVMNISKKIGTVDSVSSAARKAWPQVEDPV